MSRKCVAVIPIFGQPNAATLLNVSRPYVVKLLDEVRFRRIVGKYRRVGSTTLWPTSRKMTTPEADPRYADAGRSWEWVTDGCPIWPDANVLYPGPARDLLIQLAQAGLVRARWFEAIHGEWVETLWQTTRSISHRLARL